MQTPAEAHLVRRLCDHLLQQRYRNEVPLILNVGAGRSVAIESRLSECGCRFVCDRVDVEDCSVGAPAAGCSWQCSVEDMTLVDSARYEAAFANYVFEHVADLGRAASEVFRVLKPGAIFVASIPNLTAPEFVVARYAPAGLQKLMTQGKGFRTCYAWKTIGEFTGIFEQHGFSVDEVRFWAFTQGYLWRYPVVSLLSRLYDRVVSGTRIRSLMGNACVSLVKP
jgi:SAM-dependent methyltransferase